jgi:hypothetical protein
VDCDAAASGAATVIASADMIMMMTAPAARAPGPGPARAAAGEAPDRRPGARPGTAGPAGTAGTELSVSVTVACHAPPAAAAARAVRLTALVTAGGPRLQAPASPGHCSVLGPESARA